MEEYEIDPFQGLNEIFIKHKEFEDNIQKQLNRSGLREDILIEDRTNAKKSFMQQRIDALNLIHPKALKAAISEYFLLAKPKEVQIDDEIKFFENEGETKIVERLQTLKNEGKTTTPIVAFDQQNPEHFPYVYRNKLDKYLRTTEFSIEKDFIEDSIIQCEAWSEKVPENKLLKRWIEFLKERLSEQKDLQTNISKKAEDQMSRLRFNKPIDKRAYLTLYAEDKEKMLFYEACLKNVNPALSLNTGLTELPKIFSVIEKWDSIMSERLKVAPSKNLATELFKKELLDSIEYDDNAGINAEINKEKYWNRFRKVAYEYYAKGQNVTLQGLGYLILANLCTNEDGFDVILKLTAVHDVEGILESLAEGAALAEYLHSEKKAPTTNSLQRLPNDLITKYLKAIVANTFFETEQKLFIDNSIDENRKWLTSKSNLAGFINFIEKYKKSDVSRTQLRKFIEARFQSECFKEFQLNRLKDNNAKTIQYEAIVVKTS